jgi:large subunit ribosomal protein L33
MARNNTNRTKVTLRSSAGTGFGYVTTKNTRNDPDRLVLNKYDPKVRRVVQFRESK